MKIVNKKYIWMCVRLSAIALCFYLSFSLFQLFNESNSADQALPFLDRTNGIQLEQLKKEAEQLREQYSFMVFPKERMKIERGLIRNLQKQVNLTPFNSVVWRELTFLQSGRVKVRNESTALERKWVFMASKNLLHWNPNEKVTLLKRCALFISDPLVDVNAICSELFNDALQTESIPVLARKLGLTVASIDGVFSYFDVNVD